MASPIFAYIPYAAATLCVAKIGQAVWPTIRSQLSSATHYSSMHGLDGEDPIEARLADDCPDGRDAYYSAADNFYVRNAPPYCYDIDSNTIMGDGPLDGVHPPSVSVTLWTDEDGTELASINVSGDASITVPSCGGPSKTPPPPSRQPPQRPPGRTPPPGRQPPGDPGGCGRRATPTHPAWRRGNCGPAERNQQISRVQLRRRRGW